MQPLGFGWWVAILIYVRGCNCTNDCRRVRVRVRVTCRVSASRVSRGRCRYAAVCGLRHLLHGLSNVGVAAAHLADLQAREAHLFDLDPTLVGALESAIKVKAKALTRLVRLRNRLDALPPGEQSEKAKKLARKINKAKVVCEIARNNLNFKLRESAYKANRKHLEQVWSQIDAMRGALLA